MRKLSKLNLKAFISDHVKKTLTLCTPIGIVTIEIKSYQDNQTNYIITIEGEYIDTKSSLEDAKYKIEEYLENKMEELKNYLK